MSKLIIGWRVNHAQDPVIMTALEDDYSNDLSKFVAIDSLEAARHTAIVAQSGSGKSFFLGRLIEEILLRTKAKVIVLDPNGDYINVSQVKGEELWKRTYDPVKRRGKLTHENVRSDFEQPWKSISKTVFVDPQHSGEDTAGIEKIKVHWPSINPVLIFSDFDKSLEHEVTNCHEIVKSLGRLLEARHLAFPLTRPVDLLQEAERLLFNFAAGMMSNETFLGTYNIEEVGDRYAEHMTQGLGLESMKDWLKLGFTSRLKADQEKISHLWKYISPESAKYYFRRSQSLCASPIFSKSIPPPKHGQESRLNVVDLSSMEDHNMRQFAVNAIISQTWEHAVSRRREVLASKPSDDDRVPTFIVVDEAHNVMPVEPRNTGERIVKEQFRTIAAEGRKYGLFLIVVSQRPDKLDPMVLSECENKVVMRIGSEAVLNKTRELLGLEDVPDKAFNRILEFPTGRGMLAGSWIPETHLFFYAQTMRTEEGGKNIPEDWAEAEKVVNNKPSAEQSTKSSRAKKQRSKTQPRKRK